MAKKRTKGNSNGASRRKLTKEVITSRKEYQLGSVRKDPGLRSYMETALWSSVDEEGRPFDKDYSVSDFADEAVESMAKDLVAFEEAASEIIEVSGLSGKDVGHNFWLTRNRHGTGFWDLGLPSDIGKALTDAAHDFGESDVYLGDDGKLYVS